MCHRLKRGHQLLVQKCRSGPSTAAALAQICFSNSMHLAGIFGQHCKWCSNLWKKSCSPAQRSGWSWKAHYWLKSSGWAQTPYCNCFGALSSSLSCLSPADISYQDYWPCLTVTTTSGPALWIKLSSYCLGTTAWLNCCCICSVVMHSSSIFERMCELIAKSMKEQQPELEWLPISTCLSVLRALNRAILVVRAWVFETDVGTQIHSVIYFDSAQNLHFGSACLKFNWRTATGSWRSRLGLPVILAILCNLNLSSWSLAHFPLKMSFGD